jgi:hypothetical protein
MMIMMIIIYNIYRNHWEAPAQVARDVAKQDLEAAQLRKHEALSEEMRRAHAAQTEESRQWAQTLVERLSNDLRGAQLIHVDPRETVELGGQTWENPMNIGGKDQAVRISEIDPGTFIYILRAVHGGDPWFTRGLAVKKQ